ncbi:protein brown-like [Ostrinia nubilalis]|uniref:protein brown-like n=1 Tax=Ostrinia nubilalis TaxID=29057 RepID=UPI0030822B21
MDFDAESIDSDDGPKVVMTVDNLTVWTPEERSWWRRKVSKPKNIILDNISGIIREGEFAALLGPSGAGKTTLLVALAGKCTLPSRGLVLVGGREVSEAQGTVELLPQFDVFMEQLTVMEHLVFMTELKLGSCKNPANKVVLNYLLDELKLRAHSKTSISSLSGGEKRLLSLATSLLSSPQILICDEPTTGLDSYNAALVVETLKRLSLCGKVVICSVHQPSTDLFKEFNSILLMADGKLLFHGSQEECSELFRSINLHCPVNYNPAEFYIRAVSRLCGTGGTDESQKILDSYHEKYKRDETSASIVKCAVNKFRRNWLKQVQLLLWRSCLTLRRNIRGQLFLLFINVIASSMVIGTCYVGASGSTQRGIQDIRGLLWLMTSEVCFALSYSAMYTFEAELNLFKREVGVYSCSSYLVARFISFIPQCAVWPLTLVFITTLAVQLPNHMVTALKFCLSLSVAGITAIAYGLGMGALFTSSNIISDVMPCADLPLFLMAGAFLRLSSLPMWLQPVRFISHFYYAMDAVSNVYWRQIEHIDCETNVTSLCVTNGATVLSESGYSSDFVLQDSLGLLFVTVLWSLLAYFGLKREEKKGYAY